MINTSVDLKKELEENNLVLLVVPSQAYSGTLIAIVRQLNKELELYVTLNNPYNSLMKMLKKENISSDKCFFIDAISSSAKLKSSAKNCVFVSSPNALTELSIAINEFIKKQNPKFMIFDSLSTLRIYMPINTIVKFTQSLVTKIKETNTKAVFPTIKDDELIKNMSMFISKIIELK